jgi:lysophospholipase L1-like esterase
VDDISITYGGAKGTRNVLFIGDSTGTGTDATNSGPFGELYKLFAADTSMGIVFKGPNSITSKDSAAADRTIACGCVAGRGWGTFATSTTEFGTPWDFRNWAGYTDLIADNWVIIHLGINDMFSATTDAEAATACATVASSIATMIGLGASPAATTIRGAVSGIRVGICLPIDPADNQDGFALLTAGYYCGQTRKRHRRNMQILREYLIANYSGLEVSSKIFLVPLHVGLDTRNNFPSAATAVNARNATTYVKQTNSVHPAASGYYQMADCLYAFLKGQETSAS